MRRRPLLTVLALLTAVALAAPAGADGNEAPGAPAAARSITAGNAHTCALLDDGNVTCWGDNTFGQLGQDGADPIGEAPGDMAALDAVALGRPATAIAAGSTHTCALLDNGDVKCWGNGGVGRLGQDSTDTIGDAPGDMAALDAIALGRPATAVTAGGAHTCALLDNGDVKCWGLGSDGRLGQDSTDTIGDAPGDMAALDAITLGRPATAVTAGGAHTCALLDNGDVTCWGSGANGVLGQDGTDPIGTGDFPMSTLDAVALGRPATAVSAGSGHTCALLDNGDVTCWGGGLDGRLGQDSTDSIGDAPGDMAALDAVALGGPATAVSAGFQQTCVLLADGTTRCWGNGGLGQDAFIEIGDQPGEMATLGAIDLGGGRTATAVTTGIFYSCALLDDATLRCWGNNNAGQLGQDGTDDVEGSPRDLDPIALGGPVGVGAQLRPDAHLRRGTGAFTGLDTYNTNGAGQTRSTTVGPRGRATFTVRIQNDGTYTDTFRVRGQGGTTRYTVTYRRDGTNVTGAVTSAGGFVTPEIRAGQQLDLTLTIQAKAGAISGNRIDRLVTVTSLGNTTVKDAVKATVTRR